MKLTERKTLSNLFFIIAYTLVIIVFSISMSSLKIQNDKYKKYSPTNNTQLNFTECVNFTEDDLNKIVDTKAVSVLLKRHMPEGYTLETYKCTNGLYFMEDMKSGTYFEKDDFLNKSGEIVISINFDGIPKVSYLTSDGETAVKEFNISGVSYEKMPKALISYKDYKALFGDNFLADPTTQIIISGEEDTLKEVVAEINDSAKSKDVNNVVVVNDYMEFDLTAQAKGTMKVSLLIFVITFINSITLAYLWVEERKKEFIVRKVVGATNITLVKLFGKELLQLVTISAIISLISQGVLSLISGGYIYNIPIKISYYNIISIFGTAIVVLLITLIPFLYYLSKIQPNEILRGE